jgi:hypothetical protein
VTGVLEDFGDCLANDAVVPAIQIPQTLHGDLTLKVSEVSVAHAGQGAGA